MLKLPTILPNEQFISHPADVLLFCSAAGQIFTIEDYFKFYNSKKQTQHQYAHRNNTSQLRATTCFVHFPDVGYGSQDFCVNFFQIQKRRRKCAPRIISPIFVWRLLCYLGCHQQGEKRSGQSKPDLTFVEKGSTNQPSQKKVLLFVLHILRCL